MWVEMKVRGLALDPVSNMPIIILRDEEEKRSLPIWVGIFEANAIALELEKIATPRPMTHDLIKNVLEAVDAKIEKIVVNDLRENTFFALIHLRMGEEEVTVDSRPSDAIALALRAGAPIFVDDDVVRRAKTVETAPKEADDQEKLERVAREPEAGGFRPTQDVAGAAAGRLRVGLFTNNYFPMLGGVPTAVETIRRDLEALGHEVVIVAPRMAGADGRRARRHPRAGRAGAHVSGLRAPAAARPGAHAPPARARPRRVPRPPPVPPRRLGPAPGPGGRPSLRLHVPHALRPVRPLRAAAAPDGRAAGHPVERDVRRHRRPGHRPVRLRRAAPPDAGRAAARSRCCRRESISTGSGPAIAPAARRALGLGADDRVLLYVGRLDREKNLEFLLDAVARVRAPRIRLLLVGRGTQAAALRRAAAATGLGDRVEFRGGSPPDGLPAYYQRGGRLRLRVDDRDAGPGRPRGHGLRAPGRGSPGERHRGGRRRWRLGPARARGCRRLRGSRRPGPGRRPPGGEARRSAAGRPPRRSGRRPWRSGWWPRIGGPGESRRGAEARRPRPRGRRPRPEPRRAPGDHRARDPAGAGGGPGPNGRAAPGDPRSAGRAGPAPGRAWPRRGASAGGRRTWCAPRSRPGTACATRRPASAIT